VHSNYVFATALKPDNVVTINDLITKVAPAAPEKESGDSDDDTGDGQSGPGSIEPENAETKKVCVQGTLILGATCAPPDIRHPQDLSLIDEARRKTESIIDAPQKTTGNQPRTYRKKARRLFLSVIRKQKRPQGSPGGYPEASGVSGT
jgi:hypothetical protein